MGITKTVSLPATLGYLLNNKQAALEARSQGVRVNAVSPGFLLTDLLKPIVGSVVPTEEYDKLVARQGRPATPNEIGDVVVLLSGPRMSLVNGVNLPIDG